ncbi:hypothetical protein [Limisphaera sp. VF-2]|jgi:hypothetical protein|uniref:hypothetical protein n=1 Tax=Limisphaera sp. VF-2 TaxID=3400418 RepID=UPI00255E0314|nr:hypothetical protein [Limisphaera sp.]
MSGKTRKPTLQEIDLALTQGDEASVWKAAEALGESLGELCGGKPRNDLAFGG